VKLHFYIDSDDDADRCRQSCECGAPIAIGGTDALTGRIKSFNGIVLAVEALPGAVPGERWRVTIDSR
jgi:hypothetical protein